MEKLKNATGYTIIGMFCVLLLLTIIKYVNTEDIIYQQSEPVTIICNLDCEVEKRTKAIFERDRDLFMEQSRLEAIRELNIQLLDMVYTSPHIEQSELQAKSE